MQIVSRERMHNKRNSPSIFSRSSEFRFRIVLYSGMANVLGYEMVVFGQSDIVSNYKFAAPFVHSRIEGHNMNVTCTNERLRARTHQQHSDNKRSSSCKTVHSVRVFVWHARARKHKMKMQHRNIKFKHTT